MCRSTSFQRKGVPMKSVQRLVAAALLFCAVVAKANAADQTLIYYFSEPGDYIGAGEERTITVSDGMFLAESNFSAGVRIYFNNFSTPDPQNYVWWDANFAAPNGAPLQTG